MLLRLATIGAVGVGLCSADTLTLRNGRVITGQYLGGDARHIRMAIGDRVDSFNVEDVGDLEFGGNPPPASQPPPPDQNQGRYQDPPPARDQGFSQQQAPAATAAWHAERGSKP